MKEKQYLNNCYYLKIRNQLINQLLKKLFLSLITDHLKRVKYNQSLMLKIKIYWIKNHHIFSNIKDKSFFYFVHSYFVDPINESEILSTTNYGCTFTSGVSRDNFVALQFHPEKSSSDGLKVLKNFITWDISWKYCQLLIWRMESA